MPERIDFPALLGGHTVVIEMINSGDAGLPVLTQLLRVAQPALGATGMAFVEFGPTGGRVISATGAAEWALGRPLAVDDPDTVCLLAGPRARQVRVGHLNGKLAAELSGSDLRWMVVSRAEIGGHTVGSLHALYPGDDEPGAEQQGWSPTSRPAWRTCTATRAACRCTVTARSWRRSPTGWPSSTGTGTSDSGTRPPPRSPAGRPSRR